MKKMSSSWILYGTTALVIAGLIGFVVYRQATPGEHDEFAQCLTDKGVKMYGTWWCSHCQKQKTLFGKSFNKVTYQECSAPGSQAMNQICKDAKIEGFPTWEFKDGSRVSGVQSLVELGEKAECKL